MDKQAWSRIRLGLRILVGIPCLAGSILLLALPRAAAQWSGLGLPEWGRWTLGLSEVAAAGLFLSLKRSRWGAVALLLVLAAAIWLHLSLSQRPGLLPVYTAGVLLWLLIPEPKES